jgi:acetolactate synthase-1/2/3 large subunit
MASSVKLRRSAIHFPILNTLLIHIDFKPAELGRTTRTRLGLIGDARPALEDLSAALQSARNGSKRRTWAAKYESAWPTGRRKLGERLGSNERPINVARLVDELNKAMPGKRVFSWPTAASRQLGGPLFGCKFAGRRFVADRGFASIG